MCGRDTVIFFAIVKQALALMKEKGALKIILSKDTFGIVTEKKCMIRCTQIALYPTYHSSHSNCGFEIGMQDEAKIKRM